jgi:signal transduction histidine kinase
LPNIDGDVAQMHQLFQNLISNAIKFRDAGRACEISVSVNTFGNHCVVVIRDNGIGFDEKYLTRIFNIFQRLHGRSEYPGSGVGLAVCRRIVDRHNGQITAKSMVGQGASFLVTLPVRQKAFLG